MPKHPLALLLLLAITVGIQILLSVVYAELSVVNPFLSLLVVLAVRSGKTGGILWGAILGMLADVAVLPIGYHAISMCLIGYALSLLGGKVIIRGAGPIAMLALAAYPLDLALVTLLHFLVGEEVFLSLWWLVIPGGLFTGAIAMGLETVAVRVIPIEDRYPGGR